MVVSTPVLSVIDEAKIRMRFADRIATLAARSALSVVRDTELNARAEAACELVKGGDFATVEDVAAALGGSDPAFELLVVGRAPPLRPAYAELGLFLRALVEPIAIEVVRLDPPAPPEATSIEVDAHGDGIFGATVDMVDGDESFYAPARSRDSSLMVLDRLCRSIESDPTLEPKAREAVRRHLDAVRGLLFPPSLQSSRSGSSDGAHSSWRLSCTRSCRGLA